MDFIAAFIKDNIEERRHWYKGFAVAAVVFAVSAIYIYIREQTWDIFVFNRLCALNAMFLIGSSFAMSGLGYFWNFMDKRILSRKYLGLLGWIWALIHVTISVTYYFFVPNAPQPNFVFGYVWNIFGLPVSNVFAFLAGITAIVIFTFMASISSKLAAKSLGGGRWREFLRVGYLAYFLLIFHFGIKNIVSWKVWAENVLNGNYFKSTLWMPPLSLLIVLFAMGVLALRLALEISLRKKKHRINAGLQSLGQSAAPHP